MKKPIDPNLNSFEDDLPIDLNEPVNKTVGEILDEAKEQIEKKDKEVEEVIDLSADVTERQELSLIHI